MKSLFESKTFWLAILQGTIGVVVAIQGIHPQLGQLILAKSLLDVALRILTTSPVGI
jgi:uncharacterized membrane protein